MVFVLPQMLSNRKRHIVMEKFKDVVSWLTIYGAKNEWQSRKWSSQPVVKTSLLVITNDFNHGCTPSTCTIIRMLISWMLVHCRAFLGHNGVIAIRYYSCCVWISSVKKQNKNNPPGTEETSYKRSASFPLRCLPCCWTGGHRVWEKRVLSGGSLLQPSLSACGVCVCVYGRYDH